MTVAENNKAITSWSGFIYQGMIAVLTTLHRLSTDMEAYRNCKIKIEKLDDFSIHTDDDKCLSIHQVKCKKVKLKAGYTEAIQSLSSKKANLQDADAYLHTSVSVTDFESATVEIYKYDEMDYMPILNVIEYQISLLKRIRDINYSTLEVNDRDLRIISQRMNFSIIELVLSAHSDNMTKDIPLDEVNRTITFGKILGELKDYNRTEAKDDYIKIYKQHFAILCKDYCHDENLAPEEVTHIENVFGRINSLAHFEFEKFLQILQPQTDVGELNFGNILNANPTGFIVPFLFFIRKTYRHGGFDEAKCRYEVEFEKQKMSPLADADSVDRSKEAYIAKLYNTMFDNKKTAELYYTGDIFISREVEVDNILNYISEIQGGPHPYTANGKNFNEPKNISIKNYKKALRALGLYERDS